MNITSQTIADYKRLFYYIQFEKNRYNDYSKNEQKELAITFDDFMKYIIESEYRSRCYKQMTKELTNPIAI